MIVGTRVRVLPTATNHFFAENSIVVFTGKTDMDYMEFTGMDWEFKYEITQILEEGEFEVVA